MLSLRFSLLVLLHKKADSPGITILKSQKFSKVSSLLNVKMSTVILYGMHSSKLNFIFFEGFHQWVFDGLWRAGLHSVDSQKTDLMVVLRSKLSSKLTFEKFHQWVYDGL